MSDPNYNPFADRDGDGKADGYPAGHWIDPVGSVDPVGSAAPSSPREPARDESDLETLARQKRTEYTSKRWWVPAAGLLLVGLSLVIRSCGNSSDAAASPDIAHPLLPSAAVSPSPSPTAPPVADLSPPVGEPASGMMLSFSDYPVSTANLTGLTANWRLFVCYVRPSHLTVDLTSGSQTQTVIDSQGPLGVVVDPSSAGPEPVTMTLESLDDWAMWWVDMDQIPVWDGTSPLDGEGTAVIDVGALTTSDLAIHVTQPEASASAFVHAFGPSCDRLVWSLFDAADTDVTVPAGSHYLVVETMTDGHWTLSRP